MSRLGKWVVEDNNGETYFLYLLNFFPRFLDLQIQTDSIWSTDSIQADPKIPKEIQETQNSQNNLEKEVRGLTLPVVAIE